jgi:hypothetical protein
MHLALIASDEQPDEIVSGSRPVAAMGADAGWRGREVVVDLLHDAAALFSLALAQRRNDVPFTAAEDG